MLEMRLLSLPLNQGIVNCPPPEGTNWLGYTAIAGGTGLVGGGIGFGYKHNLAFSDVELQAGWKKLHKAGDTVQKLHLDQTITIHHGLNSKNIENSGKLPEGVKLGDNIFGYHWLKPQDSEVYGFNLLEGDEKNCKYLFQGGLIPENRPSAKYKERNLYIDEKTKMGYLGKMAVVESGNSSTKGTSMGLTPIDATKEGWFDDMAKSWVKVTNEHSNWNDVEKALEKEGYRITKDAKMPKIVCVPELFNYSSWDDVAKAAVQNKEDWWKLVPKEGMGKFIGGGAAIGVAVAAAGIGLYHALKPKPIDKRFDTNA